MIRDAKDLSPDQKTAIEGLLGRAISENERMGVRTLTQPRAPEGLRKSWESAEHLGLQGISVEDIDAEISSARRARRQQQAGQ